MSMPRLPRVGPPRRAAGRCSCSARCRRRPPGSIAAQAARPAAGQAPPPADRRSARRRRRRPSRRTPTSRSASPSSATPAPADRPQYEVGERLTESRTVFPFEFVLMLGDNIYGSERPQDFVKKFELPYKALLDLKVPFYASLGNHDDPNQRFYKPFNMDGQRYYTFEKDGVRFFALDSNYMDQAQQDWLEKELSAREEHLEDRLLPPPALLVRRTARLGGRPARRARAALPEVRRERGVLRPRALLRAPQAAEGHRLLHERRRRQAARGQHPRRLGDDGEGLRHRPLVHAGRDRRQDHVLPDAVAHRRAGGLGQRRRPCRPRRRRQPSDGHGRCGQSLSVRNADAVRLDR